MKKLVTILTIFFTTTMQSYVPQSAFERNINWIMVGGFAAMHALYFTRLNYGISAQLLEESDPFKQVVQEEFESMGITDHTSYFVKISGDQTIEQRLMIALPGGIIVADSLYQAYKQLQSDKDAVRFMVRHEAVHFRNGDYYKRGAFKVALYAALIYGFDYFINTVEQNGYLPDFLSSFKAQLLLKLFVNGPLDGLLTNYFCAYNQEHNADQQAATTAAIAASGSRALGRVAEAVKKTSLLHRWLESTPLLCRLIIGYPTYIDRSKTLAKIAERLEVKTD